MQKIKIITTLGPATDSKEQIKLLAESGAHTMRLNFSHGVDEWFMQTIENIHEVNKQLERKLLILVDTKGPEIRTQKTDTPISFEAGKVYRMGFDGTVGADFLVDYPYLTRDIPVGRTILIDGGTLIMKVTGHQDKMLLVEAQQSVAITSKRHVNVPGIHLDLPILNKTDERLLVMCIEAGVDMIALSFVNQAKDIEVVRVFLKKYTDKHISLISKIETHTAIENLESIVDASDGIMIARGDLGMEIPMEHLPAAQKYILSVCHENRKPCIIATHMMKSMTNTPTPTRAEVLDVGNAVYDGADAIMLSEETSVGEYPIETVKLMASIAENTEKALRDGPLSVLRQTKEGFEA